MTELKKTINTLIDHNRWRRDSSDEIDMCDPKEIGIAIDHAVTILMDVENLLKQRGRHNTEIAYRRLEISATGE